MRNMIAVGIVATISLTPAIAHAQDGETPIPPADFAEGTAPGCEDNGQPAMCDGTWFGDADAIIDGITATQDGVTLTVRADFDSTFFVDVVDGEATGEWKLNGNWVMDVSGAASGAARVQSTADGIVGGNSRELAIDGTMNNIGEFGFASFTQPISNSHPLNGLRSEVIGGTCVEMIGRWSMSWGDLATEVGWQGTDRITGEFAAVRQPGFESSTFGDLLASRDENGLSAAAIAAAPISNNAREVLTVLNEADKWRRTVGPPTDTNLGEFLDLVDHMEQAVNAIRNDAACEIGLDATQLQSLTGLPAKGPHLLSSWLNTEGASLNAASLRRLANTAIRTGAIGAGSTYPPEKQAEFVAAVQPHIDAVASKGLEYSDRVLRPQPGVTRHDYIEAVSALDVALDLGTGATLNGNEIELGPIASSIREEAAAIVNSTTPAPAIGGAPLPPPETDPQQEGDQ